MKYKKLVILLISFVALLFASEVVNYLSDPASQSSALVSKIFIRRSVEAAGMNKFNGALNYLHAASLINIFGEYGRYLNLLRDDYKKQYTFPDNYQFNSLLLDYLATLKEDDITMSEDQGLGKIYYNLALIAYENNGSELIPYFFKRAVYNNPEFASFHVELINYYFANNMLTEMNNEMDYCLKFKGAESMCKDYKMDSIDIGVWREIGFLSNEVENYYSN